MRSLGTVVTLSFLQIPMDIIRDHVFRQIQIRVPHYETPTMSLLGCLPMRDLCHRGIFAFVGKICSKNLPATDCRLDALLLAQMFGIDKIHVTESLDWPGRLSIEHKNLSILGSKGAGVSVFFWSRMRVKLLRCA